MQIKKLLAASAIILVSACSLQQNPAPYVEKGDRIYGKGESAAEKPKDSFKEIPNPTLEYSENPNVKGSTLDYIDSNESGKASIKATNIEQPKPQESQPIKVPEKAPEKLVEEKPVNQMSALDNIKPTPKPKLKEVAKKAAKLPEEKPVKKEVAAEEEKSPVEEIAATNKEAEVKEESAEVIKLPPKKEELKKKLEEAKPVAEKAATEKPKEEKSEAAKPEPEKPVLEKPVAKVADGKFLKPVEGNIIKKFGEKNGASTNDGINIQAAEGTPIKAAGDGSVAYSGNQLQGYGNLIIIRHSNGYLTAYAHLKDLPLKKGDEVKQGDIIGHVGKSGNVDQPQLHFGVRKGRDPVDPMQFL